MAPQTDITTRRYDPPGALEWCDQNMHLNYPLDNAATGVSSSGVILPQSFLVDMQLVLPALDIEASSLAVEDRFFISSILVGAEGIVVELSCLVGSAINSNTTGQSFVCARSNIIPLTLGNTSSLSERRIELYPVLNSYPGYDGVNRLTGYLVVGTCVDISGMGNMTFTYESTHITPMRVLQTSGMNGITFIKADKSALVISKDFTLQADDGIDFMYDTVNNTLYIQRTATAAERELNISTPDDVVRYVYNNIGGEPITTINGLPPDDDGNFVISGGDCTEIVNAENGIIINNTCSQPCCGGDNADADMTAALDTLEASEQRLISYYQAIATQINTLQARLASLLAAKH